LVACWTAAGQWWRQGEFWQLRKSPYVRVDGCRIGLEKSYSSGIRNLLTTGVFEKPEREAIRRYLDRSLPVVELGGSIGVVACTTNRRLRRPEQHVVVEANPTLIPLLEANRERNKSGFQVVHRAVGYESECVEMHLAETDPLAGSAHTSGGRTEQVRAITLESITSQYQFDKFTLVCDIEGTEFDLIQKDAETLSQRVPLMIVEIHERMLGESKTSSLMAQLEQMGFKSVYRMRETWVLKNTGTGKKSVNPANEITKELKTLVRQSSHYLFGLLASLGLGLISFPIFTRVFTVSDYGLIDLAQKILLLIIAGAKGGMQNSVLRFYNRETFAKDPAAEKQYYSTMLFGVGGLAALVTALFAVFVRFSPHRLIDGPLAAVLGFSALLILVRSLQSIQWAFLRIQERTKAFNVINTSMKFASVGAICLLLPLLGPSVRTYYSGTMLVEVAVVAALCIPLIRGGLLNPLNFDASLFRTAVLFGAPLIMQELAGIVLDSGDRVLVRMYLGGDALGFYSVAYGLSGYVNTLFYAPLGLAIIPIYMRLWNSHGREKTAQFLSLSFDAFLCGASGLFVIAAVSARDVVRVMASAKYRGADALIPILVAGLLIYTTQIFLDAGLLINKRTGILASCLGVAAVLNIALNCVLLPRMGLAGAAWATLISYLACTIALSYFAFRVLPLKIGIRPLGGYCVAAAVAWAAGARVEFGAPLWNMFSKPTIALLVYFGVLLLIDRRVRGLSSMLLHALRTGSTQNDALPA